jgi:hypothetical protein
VSSSELCEGDSPVSGFQREVAQNKEGARGILTAGFTGSRRRREGLAAAVFYSKRWLLVGAIHDVSPLALKVKTGSRHAGEASCTSSKLGKLRFPVTEAKVEARVVAGKKLPWGTRKIPYIGRGAPNFFGGWSLSRSGV